MVLDFILHHKILAEIGLIAFLGLDAYLMRNLEMEFVMPFLTFFCGLILLIGLCFLVFWCLVTRFSKKKNYRVKLTKAGNRPRDIKEFILDFGCFRI